MAVPEKADDLAAQVKPDAGASGVVTDVKAASAVDNAAFLHLQEKAAVFVSDLLADAMKMVALKYPDKGDACLEPCASPVVSDALASPAVDKSLFQPQQEAAAKLVSKVLSDALEIVASKYFAKQNGKEEKMESQAASAERLDPAATDNRSVIAGIDKQAADPHMQDGSTTSGSYTFPIKELKTQDKSSLTGTQALTAMTERDPAEQLNLHVAVAELHTKVVFMETSETLSCTEGGQLKSPWHERPESVDRWTPMSEGSEAWFTGYVCCNRVEVAIAPSQS